MKPPQQNPPPRTQRNKSTNSKRNKMRNPRAFERSWGFLQGWTLSVACGERDAFGTNPLSLASLDSSPEGGALGKGVKFLLYTGQLVRAIPSAFAKASPSRERWHGQRP